MPDNPTQTAPVGDHSTFGVSRQFLHRLLLTTAALLLVAVLIVLLWQTGRVFLLAFAGVLLGIFWRTPAAALAKRSPLSYRWALTITTICLLALIGLGWWLGAAQVIDQVNQMAERIPNSISELKNKFRQYTWGEWLVSHWSLVSQSPQMQGTYSRISHWAGNAFDFFIDVVVILFVSFYVAAEPKLYRNGVIGLFPARYHQRAREVLSSLEYNLRWWIYGRLTAMAVIGVLTGIGLSVLGVPLALTLAMIAAFLQIIPTLGPALSAIPALLIAWTDGFQMVVYVFLLYAIVQFLESYLITPLIQRQAVRLPPALTILVLLLMGMVAGILGLLVAAPLTVVIIVLVQRLYVDDLLSKDAAETYGAAESASR